MAMRITSNMISGKYKDQMNTSLNQLDYYTKRANSLRNFSKFSEDPVSASKAMRLRRSYTQNLDYQSNIKSIGATYTMAETAATDIKDILDQAKESLQATANFGTVSNDDLSTYATTLRGLQADILTTANVKLNDTYVFGGTDSEKIPFSVVGGKLQYRGVNVDEGDADTLEALSKERVYVDVGLGVNVDAAGNVDEASVFSDSLNALNFFGYGTETDDGISYSKNIYNLLGQAADAIDAYVNGDTAAYTTEIASKFTGKVTDATNSLLVSTSNLGIKSSQLDSISARLTSTQEALNEQLNEIENVNAEEAYSDYSWQQYVYSASLKIGSQLLQSSFLDYMK